MPEQRCEIWDYLTTLTQFSQRLFSGLLFREFEFERANKPTQYVSGRYGTSKKNLTNTKKKKPHTEDRKKPACNALVQGANQNQIPEKKPTLLRSSATSCPM
jgi:hypothetical protein